MAKKEKVFDPMPTELEALQDEYINLDAQLKSLEDRKKEIQAKIIEVLEANGVKKAENERIRYTYIAAGYRTSFDKEKFQEEHSDLYTKYVTKTETKPSVRVQIK
nr:MAG TPA: protein of unknown function (DUF5320) [Caudoviricetes sp.]